MRSFTNPYWRYHILKKALKRALGVSKSKRDISFVQEVYNTHWLDSRLPKKPRRALRGRALILPMHLDLNKSSVWYVAHLIRSLNIKTALEMGSGNGLFATALKILNPSVEFRGVELTDEGIAATRHLLTRNMESLIYLTEKNEEEIRMIFHRVNAPVFEKGDATMLNFPDNSFDFVFSHIAIEQMPTTYPRAFSEAYRVTKRYACFIEEFREAQRGFFQRLTLYANNYFRASYQSVEQSGFSILAFDVKEVDKESHSVGMVVCEKKNFVAAS